jgi:hypothetical protein
VATKPVSRAKRLYEQLGPTQRWKRRKAARAAVEAVLEQHGVPAAVIQPQAAPSPADVLHLSTAERERTRTIPHVHIPCEQSIIACKKLLAATHATETGTFAGGAYVTDPVRFVSVLCTQSSFVAAGGDAGGGRCALGITYSHQSVQHFAALLVYEGGDSWLELQDCRAEGLTPFTGDSAAFPHIWSVLQHLIDTRGAFLNGDWPFLNAILGLMAPSATHPCPICIIGHTNLLGTSRYRTTKDKHSRAVDQEALLTMNPERIVPTPLHLFLGLSNRIILDAFDELFDSNVLSAAVQQVKTVHSAGCGGLSDLYDLNGPEISKFIKQLDPEKGKSPLKAAAAAPTASSAQKASLSVLSRWLKTLQHHLLHKKDWELKDIEEWRGAVDDILKHFCQEVHCNPFPKLHMLRHSLEFAERHRFLGRASEAQIESFHAQFNTLFHDHHLNQGSNIAERLRRSLADAALRAVQPMLSHPSA